MQPLDLWPTAARRDLVGVFTDIDDTLTTEGAITPDALHADGAALVLMTRGAAGVRASTTETSFEVPAVRTEVVDTVGAGDTFNAGLLAGLSQAGLLTRAALRAATPEALRPAVELGARAAAITVSRAGANPPWDHEL